MKGRTQLATLLREHGLSTATQKVAFSMEMATPVSRLLREVVECETGRYLTDREFEVGQLDEEPAAERSAFLVGVPSGEPPVVAGRMGCPSADRACAGPLREQRSNSEPRPEGRSVQ